MTHVSVDTRSETPVYAQIMDQLRALVREGTLRPQAPLPPVRQLAADLEVNPNTIAKAYTLREREGVVRTAPRRGTFVADGGVNLAVRATDRRPDEAIDRVIEQAAHLSLGPQDILAAMERRLAHGPTVGPSRGEGT
jgi:GntR family transcriptional regulator